MIVEPVSKGGVFPLFTYVKLTIVCNRAKSDVPSMSTVHVGSINQKQLVEFETTSLSKLRTTPLADNDTFPHLAMLWTASSNKQITLQVSKRNKCKTMAYKLGNKFYRYVDEILASGDKQLIECLPYTIVCIALYTQCFPSVCGKKTSQATRAGFEPTTYFVTILFTFVTIACGCMHTVHCIK